MKRATAVIGAAFGDEGKGLMTDFLTSQGGPDTVVVRFNGGAQAGHTVVTPDGRRHVFHHFGAGAFNYAATYLSEYFIVNPMLWAKEHTELLMLGLTPGLFIHPHAVVTTPYDMILNQEIERHRGNGRHGSCGVGINETITRCSYGHWRTEAGYMGTTPFKERCDGIRGMYVPLRLRELDIPLSPLVKDLLASQELLGAFLDDCFSLRKAYGVATPDWFANSTMHKHVVFEGAQGLLLDEQHHFFPHVTRSRTGLTNVMSLAQQRGVTDLHVIYVLRTYMTRHGAGPFPSEWISPGPRFEDRTNVDHDFQGSLRFGWLDTDLIRKAIDADLAGAARRDIKVHASLAITHLDQHGTSETPREIRQEIGLPLYSVSTGPTRNDVENIF